MTRSPSASPTSIATDRTRTCASNCWPCTRRNSRPCATCCGRTPMLRTSDLIRRALAALTLTLLALPLAATDETEERYQQRVERKVPYRGGKVLVENGFGRLTIR